MGPSRDDQQQEASSSSQASCEPPPDERPWSDLPVEVLGGIYDRLSLGHGVRFANVCHSWGQAGISRPMRTFPLVMPPFVATNGLLRSPFLDFVTLRYKLPEAEHMPCRGAIGGWLLFCVFSMGKRSFFFDPTSENERIYLPPWPWKNWRPTKEAIISSAPTDSGACTVAFLSNNIIFHCRVGDKMWSSTEADTSLNKSTGVFFHGALHVINENQRLGVVNFENSQDAVTWLDLGVGPLQQQSGQELEHAVSLYGRQFLVESSGTLLLAFLGLDGNCYVFSADLMAMTWRPVEDLRDRSLFLAPGGSVSAVAVEAGVEANRIYFARRVFRAEQPAANWMSVARHKRSNCWEEMSWLRYSDEWLSLYGVSRWVFLRVSINHNMLRVDDELRTTPPPAGEIPAGQRRSWLYDLIPVRFARIPAGQRRSWLSCFALQYHSDI